MSYYIKHKGGVIMNVNKGVGIIAIILGLLFMIFPIFSASLVSILIGISSIIFGFSTIFFGINSRDGDSYMFVLPIIVGILAIIFGFAFIVKIDALSFLVGLQFYIIGIIMVLFGISGIFSRFNTASTLNSILIIILGIISFILGAISIDNPVLIAVIIGIVLVLEGITYLISE